MQYVKWSTGQLVNWSSGNSVQTGLEPEQDIFEFGCKGTKKF